MRYAKTISLDVVSKNNRMSNKSSDCSAYLFLILALMIHTLRSISTNLVAIIVISGMTLSFGWAQPGLAAGDDWPAGEAGIDYNLKDASRKKDGIWIRVWPNGNLYYKGQFEHGIPRGLFRFYYESGHVMSEMLNMENGRKSQAKIFRENGSLQAEGLYQRSPTLDENGEPLRQKQGEWRYYDAQGQVRMIETYNFDQLHGKSQTFAKNGKEIESGTYHFGERDGAWKTWDETGILLSEIGYSNGKFDGICRVNYSNGMPQSIGMYRDGAEHGFWKTFMEDGTLETTRKFEFGQLITEVFENGDVLLTFPDGRPREEFSVVEQKKEGAFRKWHDVGAWALKEELDEYSGESFFRRVLEGEAISVEGEYVNGVLEGEVYHYDKNGRLHRIEFWEAGKLVNIENR